MWKKLFVTSIATAGILAGFSNANVSAVSGDTATIAGGEWNICIATGNEYIGSSFVADITKTNFTSQLIFGDFSNEGCKTVKLETGEDYTVTMNKPMGVSEMSYTITGNKLTFQTTVTNKYINNYGELRNNISASKITVQFDANGGEGTMPEMANLDVNTSFTLDSNTLTRADYRFNGWNTKADGTGTSYADGETITLAKGGIVRLYAQWVQATATLKTGTNVNAALKTLAKGSSASYSDADTLIKNLSFVDTLPSTVDENTPRANIALDGEIPVYAYWVANDEAIYINTEATRIYANQDSSYMFYLMRSLTSLTLPTSFDTSKVTNMGSMFSSMFALTSLTLPDSFDTSNVTNMGGMFSNIQSFTSLTLPASFDTSKVTNMSYMFFNTKALTSLTLPDSFNTSNVTNMYQMFYGTSALTSLTLPDSFNTSNVTNMSSMFRDMQALTSLTLPDSFNTSKVTNMSYMFFDMKALTSLTLPDSFDTSKVTNMSSMFRDMQALTSLTLPDSFNTSKVTDMSRMFFDTSALTSLTLPDSFDTSKVTNMYGMFHGMRALTSLTLPDSFDTSNVTDMSYMFCSTALTSLTLPDSFNTSKVTTMSNMFSLMSVLTSLTLPDSFNTSNVTNMNSMFSSMFALTSLTLPDSFVIASGTTTTNIFNYIRNTATLYATDATARSLWPGVLGN